MNILTILALLARSHCRHRDAEASKAWGTSRNATRPSLLSQIHTITVAETFDSNVFVHAGIEVIGWSPSGTLESLACDF